MSNEPKAAVVAKSAKAAKTYPLVAAIRIRGNVNRTETIARTLKQLNLLNQHNCVILEGTPRVRGLLRKVVPFITWGTVTPETVELLKSKRQLTAENAYRLNAPRKGHGKAGIKVPFRQGGALGDRRDAINDLIKRMI